MILKDSRFLFLSQQFLSSEVMIVVVYSPVPESGPSAAALGCSTQQVSSWYWYVQAQKHWVSPVNCMLHLAEHQCQD